MSEEDEWVRVAMGDDTLVVDLLLKLNHRETGRPPPQRKLEALRLDWTVRQPRSSNSKQQRVPPRSSCSNKKEEAEPRGARASPTTPLSWSGGCGAATSSAADGFEECSRLLHAVRSKIAVAVASKTPTTKRPRKKKTLAELKGDENSLLSERRILKNQLAALQLVLEKERARNESLKRRKLDLLSRQTGEAATVAVKSEGINSDEPMQVQAESAPTCSSSPKSNICDKFEQSLPDASSHMENGGGIDSSFVLPDLNLPVDNDSGPDILYGTS